MTEAAIVEAPATPAAESAPLNVGSAAPPKGGAETVVVPPTGQPTPPPPKGTPHDAFNKRLEKLAGVEDKTKPEDKPAEAGKPAEADKPAEGTKPEDVKPGEAAKPGDKKTNPWKMVDEYKAKLAKAEAAHLETKKLIADEATRKAELEKFTKIEQRNKELEDQIRYVDYSKSQDFVEKYQKPYENGWKEAMKELREIRVDTDQGSRNFNAQDMLELVNMPLNKARETCTELFGDNADDVMAHRKELRGLFEKQAEALEDARKNGAEREKTMRADRERAMSGINKQITDQWKQLNEEIVKDEKLGRYFQPIEGDDEANAMLQKGYELVDGAFAADAMDPALTPEQREQVIRKHVAIRNRAAAFGRTKHLLEKREAELAAVRKELDQYKQSTPNLGGGKPPPNNPGEQRGAEGMYGRLEKLAKT